MIRLWRTVASSKWLLSAYNFDLLAASSFDSSKWLLLAYNFNRLAASSFDRAPSPFKKATTKRCSIRVANDSSASAC